MYRNNKGNLWLRTICITVALLGMLFFTHSQFSSATPPLFIEVTLKVVSGDSLPLDSTEGFLFEVLIKLPGSDTIASTDAVTVTYAIGTATGKTVELNVSSISPPLFHYVGGVQVTEGDNGVITFTKVSFKTSSTGATPIDYTTESTSSPVASLSVEGGTPISAQTPIEDITDVTSVKVKTSASGGDTTVTIGESVTVDVVVVNAAEGIVVVDPDAVTGAATDHILQYNIGTSGSSTDLDLFRGDNNTHFTGMLTVDAMTPAGAFTFKSVKLSLNNADGDATAEVKTYTAADTSTLTLTDAGLTTDPTSDITVLTNATAVNNTAGVGDKVTFTAWITNSTNGLPLNVTVNYKITGTKTVSDSVLLTNQGLNETDSTINLWSGTLTIADTTTAGNLTIESVFVWLKNMDSSHTSNRTITAADAMATNVVNIDVPAPVDPPVDPPTDNTTTSATAATTASASTSASSSESSSDSPVSIFAVFILIASVSMAVGVYTLRRRQ